MHKSITALFFTLLFSLMMIKSSIITILEFDCEISLLIDANEEEEKEGKESSKDLESKILQVHPMDWELAITVPTERFVTPAGGRVASKKIWAQTNRLARTF